MVGNNKVGCYTELLTSLAVIPSVTPGRATMQKTVIPHTTRGMDCETDGHGLVVAAVMH